MITLQIFKNSRKLDALHAARASALDGVIIGVPAECENVQISIGVAGNESTNACACDLRPGGEWHFYANGAFFPFVGRTLYHVTARTLKGDSVYLGRGVLVVEESVLNVPAASVPLLPDDTWVRGANGLYYRVTAELDEDGVPFMIVDPNGVKK